MDEGRVIRKVIPGANSIDKFQFWNSVLFIEYKLALEASVKTRD